MPRLKNGELEAQLKQAKRDGYIMALEDGGPRPTSEEQAARFKVFNEEMAARKIP